MSALITLLHLGTERGGTARADVSERLPLLWRQYISPAIEEILTVLTEDIGDFQPRLVHLCRPSSLDRKIGRNDNESSGLGVA
jgi:hypothetical protein